MTDSITPPRELMEQWASEKCYDERDWLYEFNIATRAAQWGADRELEACCEWLHWQNLATHPELIPSLRAARRPKPPSLKEQALALINLIQGNKKPWDIKDLDVVRRALEALPDD
jgi:hypothetical protein